jgi:hypothetical protein
LDVNVKGRANTTLSIYRTSAQDGYGDPVDDNTTPMASGVLGSLVDQGRRVFLAAENRRTVIKNTTGRVGFGTDVIEGDRIKDERTGTFYFVEGVNTPGNHVNSPDVKLLLRALIQ